MKICSYEVDTAFLKTLAADYRHRRPPPQESCRIWDFHEFHVHNFPPSLGCQDPHMVGRQLIIGLRVAALAVNPTVDDFPVFSYDLLKWTVGIIPQLW